MLCRDCKAVAGTSLEVPWQNAVTELYLFLGRALNFFEEKLKLKIRKRKELG